MDPAEMAAHIVDRRNYWIHTAAVARQAGQQTLESMALELAATYEEALRRVRQVEEATEAKLRDLFWRHRLWQSNN